MGWIAGWALLAASMPTGQAATGDTTAEDLEKRVQQLEQQLEEGLAQGPAERQAPTPRETEASPIQIGGALRFNYFWTDFGAANKTQRGQSGLDLFRINVDGERRDILISAEYRFYPFMQTLHHGWMGYRFGQGRQVEVGVSQVPFGLLPYAAHNFWFGVPYYIGLADDYDLGAKYVHQQGPLDLQLAFYKNDELGDASNLNRYAFDVVNAGNSSNEETNQINARLAYTIGAGSTCSHELGLSAMGGQLYNGDTDRSGERWATAAHVDTRCGRWNLQLEMGRYEHAPEHPVGVGADTISVGAFGTSYGLAAEGNFAVANVAYNLPIVPQVLDQVTCYNDYSVLNKDRDAFRDSMVNTTGCAVGMGPLFTYIDLVRAKNMVFFDDGSLGGQGNDDWSTRFNINLGYYF